MKRNYTPIFTFIGIAIILAIVFASMMPLFITKNEEALAKFSTERAFAQVTAIAQKPHYVGSENHEVVANYLIAELGKLGLEVSTQEGFTLNDYGILVKSKNILARIKGSQNTKALLLLSHYDSAPHSYSKGASDDASGVATILEGVRAYLYTKQPQKNDIIILFSDAEELGLNGAALFVNEHPWSKDVGLVINFEARGSSGPSYMLLETNGGNAKLISEFKKAGARYPVSNSLMYSIYKMLPNDTDLTVFREQGNIQGFNFAFIDGHYNYHTQQDDPEHLSKKTLKHQGTYLTALLNYFANANLKDTTTKVDNVYFNIPFAFITYPFDWVLPMTIIALGLLVFFMFIAQVKRLLDLKQVLRGFIPLFGSLLTAGLLTFLGWKLIQIIYPQYDDFLNGFTYNGHAYIGAFIFLSIAISFAFYSKYSAINLTLNHYIAPLLLWIVINLFIANTLTGAGFLIIPVLCGVLIFGFYVISQRVTNTLNLILSIPALALISPFIIMFPIGLGLKVLFGSAILTVLTFVLLLPLFGLFRNKLLWSFFFFIAAMSCLIFAHLNSAYDTGKAKSNSLLYVYNADSDTAKWCTYDQNLDHWTSTYIDDQNTDNSGVNTLPIASKYNSSFTFSTPAPKINLPKPSISFLKDSIVAGNRYLTLKISPNRNVNRYDIFASTKMDIYNLRANGVYPSDKKDGILKRKGKKILSYYVVNNEPLVLEFYIKSNAFFDMDMIESSFDLFENKELNVIPRKKWMMPTPFVLNDALLIEQKIKPTTATLLPETKTISDSTLVAKGTLIKEIKNAAN